jgi:hypothetical protein
MKMNGAVRSISFKHEYAECLDSPSKRLKIDASDNSNAFTFFIDFHSTHDISDPIKCGHHFPARSTPLTQQAQHFPVFVDIAHDAMLIDANDGQVNQSQRCESSLRYIEAVPWPPIGWTQSPPQNQVHSLCACLQHWIASG